MANFLAMCTFKQGEGEINFNMSTNFKKKTGKTLLLYNVFFAIVVFIIYCVITKLLSYPPNSINTEFEKNIDMGFNFNAQYIVTVLVGMTISNGIFLIELHKIRDWEKYIGYSGNDEKILKRLTKIKRDCFKIPTTLYVIHALIPPIVTTLGLLLAGTKPTLVANMLVVIFMIFITLGLLIYIFSKNLLSTVFEKLGNTEKHKTKFSISGYRMRMFFQFFPLVLIVGCLSYLATNSVMIEEKGEILFQRYYEDLETLKISESTSKEEMISKLNTIEKYDEADTLFILKGNDINSIEIVYQDNDEEITEFFEKYTFFWGDIHHTYGYYASGIQGAYQFVNLDGDTYAVGVMYSAEAISGYAFVFGSLGVLLLVVMAFLAFFAKDFTKSITKVSNSMEELANGKFVDYNQKLPVISNDEIGDLTINFNKILDLEKQYVETIKQNQDILVENERLSSLGQLIGGIAHNLKTPIMSVSGYLVAIEKLADEFKESIGNPMVTKEDYEDITREMKEWIEKSKDYMTYMTEVINAAKGQAVSMNANTIGSFSVKELILRTQILMKEELKKYNCNLNIKLNVNENTEIKGELSAIVQVLDNLISNAMQAYGTNEGEINLTANEDAEKIYIEIQDFAGGIPEHIKDKLFKEMITTKGKDGTGLGLYMCYSTIKGKFNGDIRFESQTGVGTTFYITLNKVV